MLMSKIHVKEHEFHHELTLTFFPGNPDKNMLENITWIYLQHVIVCACAVVVVQGSLKTTFFKDL